MKGVTHSILYSGWISGRFYEGKLNETGNESSYQVKDIVSLLVSK